MTDIKYDAISILIKAIKENKHPDQVVHELAQLNKEVQDPGVSSIINSMRGR